VDHQFFREPPKEIPHGYMCAYIPDGNNPVYSAQQAVGGMSGIDADKQAWLALGPVMIAHTRPQEFKLWIRLVPS
jgi:hypothetical protein